MSTAALIGYGYGVLRHPMHGAGNGDLAAGVCEYVLRYYRLATVDYLSLAEGALRARRSGAAEAFFATPILRLGS